MTDAERAIAARDAWHRAAEVNELGPWSMESPTLELAAAAFDGDAGR